MSIPKSFVIILALCAVLLTTVSARAQGLLNKEVEPLRGGEVVVNGNVLSGHHFYRKGTTMFFPVSVISGVLGRRVRYDLSGQNMSCQGHTYQFSDAFKINEFVYVSWLDLTRMMPDLRIKAGRGKVMIEAGLYAAAGPSKADAKEKTPETAEKGKEEEGDTTVTTLVARLDFSRQIVVDAVIENRAKIAKRNVVATLVLVDDKGVTSDQGHKYASLEKVLGTMEPGAARTITFETGIRNPQNLDSAARHIQVELAGFGLNATTVDISYHVDLDHDEK